MSSLVAALCIIFRYEPSVGESSLANPCRTCLAVLLSHVRVRLVIIGDISAVTIAEVEEKFFSLRHALMMTVSSYHVRGKNSNLCRRDPKLVLLDSLIYIFESVTNK